MSEALVQIQLTALPEGGFLATSEDLPGLVAQGRTVAETLEIAQDVARKLLDCYLEHGHSSPQSLRKQPRSQEELRIPVSLP